MRFMSLALLVFLIAIGGLTACNSNETNQSRIQTNASTPRQLPPPSDNARRITAAELYDVWQKGDVVVIDTRDLKSYQGERIKGSISMPTGTVLSRFGELPRDKMIVAYCTWPNEHTSAGAVLELKTKGIDNAAALLGGLAAWKASGYPVEGSSVK